MVMLLTNSLIKPDSRLQIYYKQVLLKFCKIDRKTPVSESLFNKVVGLRPATLLKKRHENRCFHVNSAKFLRVFFY